MCASYVHTLYPMMVFYPELITTGGVLLVAAGALLWSRARSRERLWREAVAALVAHDHQNAAALLESLNAGTQANSITEKLRRTMDEVQAEVREQQRGRRELEEVLSSLQDAV